MTWRKSTRSFSTGGCVEVDGWRTASRCAHGQCVEVATMPLVAVRDTKDNGTGPVLTFTGDSWAAFISRVKAAAG